MTLEDKQLLLKDLCARLPYGVKIIDEPAHCLGELFLISTTDMVEYETETDTGMQTIYNIKPYLRPMSSMTKEENEELKYEIELELQALEGEDGHNTVSAAPAAFEIDFYNKHHIDYRGLIPMGLALEAPKDMYKTE